MGINIKTHCKIARNKQKKKNPDTVFTRSGNFYMFMFIFRNIVVVLMDYRFMRRFELNNSFLCNIVMFIIIELPIKFMQLIRRQQWHGCWWETNWIWKISGLYRWKMARTLRRKMDCFSWKHLHLIQQMLERLLRWSFGRSITMLVGKYWILIRIKRSYHWTG